MNFSTLSTSLLIPPCNYGWQLISSLKSLSNSANNIKYREQLMELFPFKFYKSIKSEIMIDTDNISIIISVLKHP